MKPPSRKAGPPALGLSKHALVRTSAIPAVLIGAAALACCAQKLIPPDISGLSRPLAIPPARWRANNQEPPAVPTALFFWYDGAATRETRPPP